VRKRNKS